MAIVVLGVMPAFAQDAPVCGPVDAAAVFAACGDLNPGDICIASGAPQASLREDVTLAAVDERVSVNSFHSVTTQPSDVVRVRLAANLDDDLAMEGLLLGGATLTNVVPNVGMLDAFTSDNARVRSTPDTFTDANILDVLPAGSSVTAVGRDEAGDWLQIRYGDGAVGWTADFLLSVNGDIMTLPVGQAEVPVFSPMQSFTLATPLEAHDCAEGAPPGMLLYSPTPNTRFSVNGANVTFDGVLYAMPAQQVGRPAVRLELLSGRAVVQTEQGVQFVVPGSATTVVVSADLMTPLDAPLEVMPGTPGLAALLTPFAAQLSNSVVQTLVEPAQGGAIDAQMLSLFAPDGLLPGQYRLTNLIVDAPTPLPAFNCALGSAAVSEDWGEMVVPQVGSLATFSPDMGAALLETYQVDVLPGVQISGASLNDHNNPLYRTIPESNGENAARTIVVNSLTSFTYIESWAVRSGELAAACYNQFTWEWTAP
jgi:hypothetical protein